MINTAEIANLSYRERDVARLLADGCEVPLGEYGNSDDKVYGDIYLNDGTRVVVDMDTTLALKSAGIEFASNVIQENHGTTKRTAFVRADIRESFQQAMNKVDEIDPKLGTEKFMAFSEYEWGVAYFFANGNYVANLSSVPEGDILGGIAELPGQSRSIIFDDVMRCMQFAGIEFHSFQDGATGEWKTGVPAHLRAALLQELNDSVVGSWRSRHRQSNIRTTQELIQECAVFIEREPTDFGDLDLSDQDAVLEATQEKYGYYKDDTWDWADDVHQELQADERCNNLYDMALQTAIKTYPFLAKSHCIEREVQKWAKARHGDSGRSYDDYVEMIANIEAAIARIRRWDVRLERVSYLGEKKSLGVQRVHAVLSDQEFALHGDSYAKSTAVHRVWDEIYRGSPVYDDRPLDIGEYRCLYEIKPVVDDLFASQAEDLTCVPRM